MKGKVPPSKEMSPRREATAGVYNQSKKGPLARGRIIIAKEKENPAAPNPRQRNSLEKNQSKLKIRKSCVQEETGARRDDRQLKALSQLKTVTFRRQREKNYR